MQDNRINGVSHAEARRLGTRAHRWLMLATLGASLSTLGCQNSAGSMAETGAADGAGGSGGPGSDGGAGTGGSADGGVDGGAGQDAVCDPAAPMQVGLTRLRRMTRSQFNHTVRDLLGIEGDPASVLSPDERVGPFASNAISPITNLLVQQHGEVAASLARTAAEQLDRIMPCDVAAGGTDCVSEFVATFGLRAFRRPLQPDEVNGYVSLFELGNQEGVENGMRLVLEAMLQSPFFLYHTEVGTLGTPADAPVPLSSYEIASRLSYFIWNTMPDDELFTLAQADALSDPSMLEVQVDRMLADPRASDAIPAFHLQWLGIGDMASVSKDPALYPQFDAEFVEALIAETADFSDFVVRQGDGLLSTLLTADFSVFDDTRLFDLYGAQPPPGFVPGQPVGLDPVQRSGLLTQGAFLATHAHRDQTSPVHRGIFVRENLMCQIIPAPPPEVMPNPPAASPNSTARERIEIHQTDPACGSCHRLIDNIGLGFENYDALGIYRSQEAGLPVDARGDIVGSVGGELDGPFNGVEELALKLATSDQVAQCVTRQWFKFALGRSDSNDDVCSLEAMHQDFVGSGRNVRELIKSIVLSDAFRHVRLVAQ